MSKNVLIVSSSPRKGGNSDLLCDEFLRGAQEAGHSAEKIRIPDQDIDYCTGCCFCIGNRGSCAQNDDMPALFDKILGADVLVLATPVYFRSMCGQMKTFIDRLCPIYAMIHDKDVYFIVSAAGGSFPVESTVESLRVFTNCLSGIREQGVIASTGYWDSGMVEGTPLMREAYDRGRNV